MSAVTDKIRDLSKQAADKKVAEEQKKIEENVNKDIKVIETILAMVKDRLVYKKARSSSYKDTYTVVTEEVVLQDYSNRPEYGSGTEIRQIEAGYYDYPHMQIRVNGHIYLHAVDLITAYKFNAKMAMEKAEIELDAARRRKELIESMEALEPVIKELMLNYDKHLGAKLVKKEQS